MKVTADIVGRESGPEAVAIDTRWLMAYNAALGEVSEAAHALFPVCYEWPANRALRVASGLQGLNERLVHAQHDLTIHRAARAGETLRVGGRILSVAQRKPGAFVVMRMQALGADGDAVSTTDYGMLYRGVQLEGAARAIGQAEDPPPHATTLQPAGEIAVAATAGHVYTECARIWNPIHTEPAYARKAGLPGIILHGTATLAFSISRLVRIFGVDTVRRVRCRFAGMVLMPSTLTVHASRIGDEIFFETRDAEGKAVIERGRIG
jgi:acyl dehydratase